MLIKRKNLEKQLAYYQYIYKLIKVIDLPGRLDIYKEDHKVRYYHVFKDEEHLIKNYLNKDEMEIAKDLAQKSYNKKISNCLSKRIKQFQSILKSYSDKEIDEIYLNLSSERKSLVTPVQNTWDQILENWIKTPFTPSKYPFPPQEIYTKNKERVRSKSEKILADLFFDSKIPYKYECPLKLQSGIIVYPDFTFLSPVTGKEIYWEHNGMMDNPSYMANAFNKIKLYEMNGIIRGENLIVTYEASDYGLDLECVYNLITRLLLK